MSQSEWYWVLTRDWLVVTLTESDSRHWVWWSDSTFKFNELRELLRLVTYNIKIHVFPLNSLLESFSVISNSFPITLGVRNANSRKTAGKILPTPFMSRFRPVVKWKKCALTRHERYVVSRAFAHRWGTHLRRAASLCLCRPHVRLFFYILETRLGSLICQVCFRFRVLTQFAYSTVPYFGFHYLLFTCKGNHARTKKISPFQTKQRY